MLNRISSLARGLFIRDSASRSARHADRNLWHLTLGSFTECKTLIEAHVEEFHQRRLLESRLEEQLGEDEQGILAGECWVCSTTREFLYDRNYSDGTHVNWRERLVCPSCGLNNRLRLCAQLIERLAPRGSSLYLTEQVTALASRLSRRYRKLAKSEYLGDDLVSGSVDARGIRHEDVTALSFRDQSFDYVLSFDVLEHVPDYRKALAEFRRVLKDDGGLVLSVPFALLSEKNIVRARIGSDGEVEHLLAPEFHGDPVDPHGGILCYYHFGWQLLDELEAAGFRGARIEAYWSLEYGHIGDEQLVIVATR